MSGIALLLLGSLIGSITAIPKYDDFKPSSIDYNAEKSAKSQDQMAIASQSRSRNEAAVDEAPKAANEINERSSEPRFGYTNVGDSTGYGVSSYAPARIDLGGLLLGAVIGIGTILVIPKLLYVLSGSYGAYARSEDGGIAQIMTRLDDALAHSGVDSTTCMQRVACSYARQAAESLAQNRSDEQQGAISTLDKIVDTLSTSPMFRTALQGTAVQEALEAGRTGQNCAKTYRQCGFSAETMIGLMAKFAAAATAVGNNTGAAAAA
ncbi:uncharacterized protein LOC106652158 [Trichogramma pretiosum]|uniref:uncharacterized protein LOC106652158 n=1 Tax=Trichogramma pretiosum TaxID=7493 RepID=UPI0006C99518|nr:uncharacterized protein LOC106652158 [Trichogramma pretiosum]